MKVFELLAKKGHDVATISHDRPITEAVAELRGRGIGALIVTGDVPPFVGIFSERDVVAAIAELGVEALLTPVSRFMSSRVVTCRESETLEKLMSTMTQHHIRHIPVVENDALVGMVSIGDVVKYRVEQLENDKRDLLEYVIAR